MQPMLDRKQIDFLHWHAVSKLRMGDFEASGTLFRLLKAVCPERTDIGLGFAYSLVRQGALEEASAVVSELRRRPMRPEEMALLGRLHRRCEFESRRLERAGRHATRSQATTGEAA